MRHAHPLRGHHEKSISVVVLAIHAGAGAALTTSVEVSDEEHDDGEHYRIATRRALAAGFYAPMLALEAGDLAGLMNFIRTSIVPPDARH